MRVFLFLLVGLLILGFSACQSGIGQSEDTLEITSSKAKREYFRFNETKSFMTEYGEVIRYAKSDSISLEYCKDSSSSFHPISNKHLRENQRTCYPDNKTVFVNNELSFDTLVKPIQKFFKKDRNNGSFQVENNGKSYTISHLISLQSEDKEGKKILVLSNEYWSDEFGMIVKVDENFMIRRRRIIRTTAIENAEGQIIDIDPFITRIYQDSSTWLMKRVDGELTF